MRGWRRAIGKRLDRLCGDPGRMAELYGEACVRVERQETISRICKRNRRTYLIIAAGFLILLGLTAAERIGTLEPLRQLERPEAGAGAQPIPVRVSVERNGDSGGFRTLKETLELNVGERIAGRLERRQKLEEFAEALPQRILGENPDADHVSDRLKLTGLEEPGGPEVRFETDRPDLIGEDGSVACLRENLPQTAVLKAVLAMGEETLERELMIRVIAPTDQGVERRAVESELAKMAKTLSQAGEERQVQLPVSLPGGMTVTWHRGLGIPTVEIGTILGACFFLVWRGRYASIRKEIRWEREEMSREFPNLLNQMVLLLSAGMVTGTAIGRIAENYHRTAGEGQRRPLYEALCRVRENVERTNAPLARELAAMAGQSGLMELSRFASIVRDNLNKGNALAEKLASESELLWMRRKKMAQEQGRIAETKMALPMMILLITLIVITTAPALMEMNG